MRDITARITDTYKNAIAQECTKRGIDHKTEAAYAVGGGGAISPMVVNGELQGFGPTWMFTFELRHTLLGQPPISGSLPVHDVVPNDAAIQGTAARLVTEVEQVRQAQFKGEQ